MAITRITLSVPEELAARIKQEAGAGTVSGWVVGLIEEHLAEDADLERRLEDSLAAEPPGPEDRRRADELFDQLFPRSGSVHDAA